MSERYHCNECSFRTDVRVMMKDHAAVLGHFGCTDNEAVAFPETLTSFTANAVTIDFTMAHVDPDLLGILTGGVMGNQPAPTFAFEAHYPVKRTFWQWLRRKPRLWNHVYIPDARLATEEEMNDG